MSNDEGSNDEPVIDAGSVVMRTHPDVAEALGSLLGENEGRHTVLETRGILHVKQGGSWLYFVESGDVETVEEGVARVLWATLAHGKS